MGMKNQKKWSGIQQILSIDSLVKRNESGADKIINKTNYDILLKNNENSIDTYIIEKRSKIGGIAILEEEDLVRIILGSRHIDDRIIHKSEFETEYEVYDNV